MRSSLTATDHILIWLLFAGPVAIVLGLVVWLAGLSPVAALLAWFAIAVLVALPVTYYLREAKAVAGYLDQLVQFDRTGDRQAPMPRPPRGRSDFTRALVGTIAALYHRPTQRERARVQELARVMTIIRALPDPIITVGSDRVVRDLNPAAKAMFGDWPLNRDLSERLRHPAILEAVEEVVAGAKGRSVAYSPAGPVERVYEVRIQPFDVARTGPDADEGADTGALLSLHDVTASKRSEQMRADFVANASHELRTPLSTLVGFIETIRGPARDDAEARDKFLGIMAEQANRMSRLVSDLLSLSRIELDEHTPPVDTVDLGSVVASVVRSLDHKAKRRGMAIEPTISADLPRITGDGEQLTQVVQNLIDNAINYGRDGTPILVGLSEGPPGGDRQGGITLRVTDQGDGIAKEHLPRLTERFYRVDPARSRAIGGTGLGLAIVKHIVSRHRARLSFDSIVGQGTTVTVRFPGIAIAERRADRRSAT